jgi:hypothetical protein
MTKRYFAFNQGLRGPEGQTFAEIPVNGNGKPQQSYLFGPVEVGSESLDELILKFKDKLSNEHRAT